MVKQTERHLASALGERGWHLHKNRRHQPFSESPPQLNSSVICETLLFPELVCDT